MARIDGWLGKDDPLGGKGQLARAGSITAAKREMVKNVAAVAKTPGKPPQIIARTVAFVHCTRSVDQAPPGAL
jgi:hypothetical protein